MPRCRVFKKHSVLSLPFPLPLCVIVIVIVIVKLIALVNHDKRAADQPQRRSMLRSTLFQLATAFPSPSPIPPPFCHYSFLFTTGSHMCVPNWNYANQSRLS